MAHTPGPWNIDGIFIAGPNDETIAEIVDAPDDRDDHSPNAHLIAAAPDLLAAIKALLAASMYRDHPAESDMAIAAIAKAEGKR